MGILIGADFVPTVENEDCFAKGEGSAIIGNKLSKVFQEADYRIFNLEVPLTDIEDPIDKCGPNLIAKTACVNGYKAVGTDLLCLANNHIMDQNESGLFSTIDTLRSNHIAYVGAGKNVAEASEPFLFNYNNKKVGVYACAEHEFSIAGASSPGANPFEPRSSYEHVSNLKKVVDYVIVLYHGGKEHYQYPSPGLQETCRKFIDYGANLVVCQHSHCIGSEEKYNLGTIIYGQGNFLFGKNDRDTWNKGLLLLIDDIFQIHYIPIEIVENGAMVELQDEASTQQTLALYSDRSSHIITPGFLDKEYDIFADSMIESYLKVFCGKESLIFKALNRITGNRLRRWRINHRITKKELLAMINFIECEAHRDLLIRGLKNRMKNSNK